MTVVARASYKADAILLRSLDYGESDRIVTFLTDDFGKIKGIAKGARRSRKRFANALEICSLSRIIFSRRNRDGLALIENCDVGNHYPGIRADLASSLTAAYLVDLVDQFTLEGKKHGDLFRLVQDFLELLEEGHCSEGMVRIFELRLLKLLGYEPVLDRCMKCGTPLDKMTAILFDPLEGGIRCPSCRHHARDAYPTAPGTVKLLLLGKDMETGKISRLAFSAGAEEESRKMLAPFIRHLLGKELKSLNVLNEIKRMAF